MERRLAAILAADVVGYSRLMGEDEAGTYKKDVERLSDRLAMLRLYVPKRLYDLRVAQAEANCGVSDLPAMPSPLVEKLRRHNWRRGVWYGGK